VSPQVLTLRWVRAIHDPVVSLLAAAHAWLDRQAWYAAARAWLRGVRQAARRMVAALRARVGGWLNRRQHLP
jgi:hypothetical protein